MTQGTKIIGRYAPSPTGDLHLGNVRTALIAWLHARIQNGGFLMRMEDIDLPRVVAGSAERIIRDLEWLGLDWDGEVVYQSKRTELYQSALAKLQTQALVYPCFCSRKDIREAASAPHEESTNQELIYPGTCTQLSHAQITLNTQRKTPALRVRVPNNLMSSCGDFVIKRADQLFAYQLVVVVDDLAQGVTDIVRGADLLQSTERQCYLAKQLQPNRRVMNYLHVPLMFDSQGYRMSKRFGSTTLDEHRNEGKTAEQLVGQFAFDLNLIDQEKPLSASELLSEIDLLKLNKLGSL